MARRLLQIRLVRACDVKDVAAHLAGWERGVRADERARVLAEFTEERATSWETGEVDYRRFVGPWRLDGD